MLTSIAHAMPMLERPILGVQMKMLKEEKPRDAKTKTSARQYDATAQVSTTVQSKNAACAFVKHSRYFH